MSKESELTGKVVTIYEDPVTREKVEGEALICKVLTTLERTDSGTYYQCEVRFEDDNGESYIRTVFVQEV